MFRSSFTRFSKVSSTRHPCGNKKHLLKVDSSLQPMNATLMAVFVILLAGDISRNPGRIHPDTPQVENIPVLVSNRRNLFSRFKQPSQRNVTLRTHSQSNYPNGNFIYIPCQIMESSYSSSENKPIRGQSHCIKTSHLNVRSLKNREYFHQVSDFINNSDFDVFTVSETCFNSTVRGNEINISVYRVVRLDWAKRRGAGVRAYIRSLFKVSILRDITSTSNKYGYRTT